MEVVEVPAEGENADQDGSGDDTKTSPTTNSDGGHGSGVEGEGRDGERRTAAAFRVTVSTLKKEIGKFQDLSAGRAWRAALRSIGAEVSSGRLFQNFWIST